MLATLARHYNSTGSTTCVCWGVRPKSGVSISLPPPSRSDQCRAAHLTAALAFPYITAMFGHRSCPVANVFYEIMSGGFIREEL